ncbi:MAG: leucine-rich repeat protein [Eubacteriales bacterium]
MKFTLTKKIFIILLSLLLCMSALPYSYTQNEKVAKAEVVTSSGLVFENGSIIGYEGTSPVVNIPDTINGQAVTTIDGAFESNDIITSVTIPEGVTQILGSSFLWCENLQALSIPSTVTKIEPTAIGNCPKLTVTLSELNTSFILGADGVLYNADQSQLILYLPKNTATSFTVPTTVTTIYDYAFAYSSSLSTVAIPAETISIGAGAFHSCSSLQSIAVDGANPNYVSTSGVLLSKSSTTLISYPANRSGTDYTIANSVTTLADIAFMGCKNLNNLTFGTGVKEINSSFHNENSLQNIIVPEGNANFASIDGVLTSKDGKTLYYYPSGRTAAEYIVPAGITIIGSMAFTFHSYIQKVTLHENVATIQTMAFIACPALKTLIIPAERTTFEFFAIIPEDGFGIWGYAYSDSQSFAEMYGIPFYTMGKATDWEYTDNENGTCDITKYKGTLWDVFVPSTIDGLWVSNVSVTTFDGCTEVEYITFSEAISSIDVSNSDGSMYMFEDCISLREVYFSSTVNNLNSNGAIAKPFKGAISLVNIIVDDGNTSYYDVDGVLFSSDKTLLCYPSGKTASTYTIPNGTKDILYTAFNNVYLKTVTVPGTVTALIKGAEPTFKNNIATVYLNEGVETVEDVFSETTPTFICFPNTATSIMGFDVSDIHTFYVFEGSAAHTYAVDNSIKYVFLCLVTFDSNGGTSAESQVVPVGSKVSAPSVTKEGFVIQGWFTDPELTNRWYFSTDLAASSMTLYAKWVEGYPIIYHMNGGVNNKANPSYYIVGETVILKDATKANYLFDGWYTDSSCALKYKTSAIEKDSTGVVELWADWWVNSGTSSSGSINSSTLISERQPEITYKNFPSSVLYMQDNQEITVTGTIEIKYGDVDEIYVDYSGETTKLYKYQENAKRISSFSYSHTFNIGEIDYDSSDSYKITVRLATMQYYIEVLPIYKSTLMTEVVGSYDGMIYFGNEKTYELRAMAVSGNYFEIVNATFQNLNPEICEIKNGNILVPKAAGVAKIQTKLSLEDGSVLKYENEFTISDKTIKEPSRLERELQCQCYGKYCSGFPDEGIDPALIELIEKIEEEIGKPVYIVSGYRCEEYNKIFGGNKDSEHVHGTAADIWVKDMTIDELYEICDILNENGGVGKYSDHIHIDTRGEYLRWNDEN